MTSHQPPASVISGKPRYELLDGLRGVAAFLVIWFHFGEGFATSAVDQMVNHGYLAVDFFSYFRASYSGTLTIADGKKAA